MDSITDPRLFGPLEPEDDDNSESLDMGKFNDNFLFMSDEDLNGSALQNLMADRNVMIDVNNGLDSQRNMGQSLFQSSGNVRYSGEHWNTTSDPIHNPSNNDNTPKDSGNESDVVDKGVHVSIPRCSTHGEGDGKTIAFHIVVSATFSSWELVRTLPQIQQLESDFSRQIPHCHIPVLPVNRDGLAMMQSVDDTRSRLEHYLQSILKIRDVWSCNCFNDFFEMSSLWNKLELIQLREQSIAMKDLVHELRQQLQLAVNHIGNLHDRLRSVEDIQHQQSLQMTNHQNQQSQPTSISPATSNSSSPATTLKGPGPGAGGSGGGINNKLSKSPGLAGMGPTGMGPMGYPPSQHFRQGDSSYSANSAPPSFPYSVTPSVVGVGGGGMGGGVASVLRKGNRPMGPMGSRPTAGNDRVPEKKVDQPRYLQMSAPPGMEGMEPSRESNIPTEFRQTCLIERRLIPSNSYQCPSPNDIIVDDVVRLVEPCGAQVNYRLLLLSFVSRIIRKALNAKAFELGPVAVNAFLPEDPVRISAFLCRSQEHTWHTKLHEKFNSTQSQINAIDDNMIREDNADGDLDIDDGPLFPISNINISVDPSHGCYTLACQVAGIDFEINANMRYDLLLTALLEDFDHMIGKENLFKKTLLLIRGWWIYESRAYFAGGLQDTLSDSALCVLICSIFNRFHNVISSPLQAFGYFLSEYAGLEWSACVVTLHGPVPFMNGLPDMSNVDTQGELISSEQMIKYQDMFREPENNDQGLGQTGGTTPSPNTISTSATGLNTSPVDYQTASTFKPSIPGFNLYGEKGGGRPKFDRQQINIVHPLCSDLNMVTESLTPSKLQNITLFLQESANMLQFAYDHALESDEASLSDYFRVLSNTFGKGWRPDMPPEDIGYKLYDVRERELDMQLIEQEGLIMAQNAEAERPDFMSGTGNQSGSVSGENSLVIEEPKEVIPKPIARLLDRVRYCNLILEGRVTESALLVLCRDIIIDRGALPVGEVGKMLQEMTGMTSLSANLKEKFGGLKKFLEKYPQVFIICVDHPFNPHVFLKETLTQDELVTVMSGVVPDYMLNKLKKKISRKKKTSSAPMDSMSSMSSMSMSGPVFSSHSQSLGPLSSYMSQRGDQGFVMGGSGGSLSAQGRRTMGGPPSAVMSPHVMDQYGAGRGRPERPDMDMRGGGTGPSFGKLTYPGAGASAMRFREPIQGQGGGPAAQGQSASAQFGMQQLPKRGQAAMLAARQRQMMVAYQLQQDQNHRQNHGQHQQLQMQRAYTMSNDMGGPDPRAPSFFPKGPINR